MHGQLFQGYRKGDLAIKEGLKTPLNFYSKCKSIRFIFNKNKMK